MLTPITWFGSKGRLAKKLVPLFPVHETFVDVFGGSAAVLLAKEPSGLEVYNDVDRGLVNFFQVLRDKVLSRRLIEALALTPVSREEFRRAVEPASDTLESARRFMVRTRQSYAGRQIDWSCSSAKAGKNNAVKHWKSGLRALEPCHRRLLEVQIECLDWRMCLWRYDGPQSLFYIDPPYLLETRGNGGYRHELDYKEHLDLIRNIQQLQGHVVLSGYRHTTYKDLEQAGWTRTDFVTKAWAADDLGRRIESVWLKPVAGLPVLNRYQRAAQAAHQSRVEDTERRVRRCIKTISAQGSRVTKAEVGRRLKMSREHLSTKYAHLFTK